MRNGRRDGKPTTLFTPQKILGRVAPGAPEMMEGVTAIRLARIYASH